MQENVIFHFNLQIIRTLTNNMSFVFCTLDEADAKLRASGLLKLVNDYNWLINSYVVEFFTQAHWQKLPQDWQMFFEAISPLQCYEFIGSLADHDSIVEWFCR